VRVLDKLVWQYGLPTALRVDSGPEFVSTALDAWASAHGVKLAWVSEEEVPAVGGADANA
jgi:transposase InsO family protein